MSKLLQADLYRILKSKLFLAVAIIAVAFPILTVLVYLGIDKILAASADYLDGIDGSGIISGGGLGLTGQYLISEAFTLSSNMGLILPIFITIFIAMDISNGTLRNKIIAGKTRTAIYFSHLFSSAIVSCTLILINVLLFMGLACLVFGYGAPFNGAEAVRIVYFLITGVFTFFFSASISTAITLSIKSSAPSVIISVLAGMCLSIISSLVHSVDAGLTNKWFCLIPTYTNSMFLASGTFGAGSFWLGILSYVIFGAAFTLAGLYFFRTKDIK